MAGEEGEIVYENFNADSAIFEVNGFNVHPGSAKDIMVNAQLVAMEINAMLPKKETPRDTQGYECILSFMFNGRGCRKSNIALYCQGSQEKNRNREKKYCVK